MSLLFLVIFVQIWLVPLVRLNNSHPFLLQLYTTQTDNESGVVYDSLDRCPLYFLPIFGADLVSPISKTK